jgi:hypothetical protein
MVMTDHCCCIQVGSIAHCMTVADNNDMVIVRNGRSDGCIDTGVSCPAGDEDSIRRNSLQDFLQRGSNKRIVQCLLDHNIVGMKAQFWKKRPPFRVPLKGVAHIAAVPDQMTFPDCLRTMATNKLIRRMTPCKSYLGGPLSRPSCISTTTIASTGCLSGSLLSLRPRVRRFGSVFCRPLLAERW